MTKNIVGFIVSVLLTLNLQAQDHGRVVLPANPDDVKSIDAIINSLYEVISGEAGAQRDWDRFRTLWHAHANLTIVNPMPDGSSNQVNFELEKFIELSGGHSENNSFYEIELARSSESFGHVAQVRSSYIIKESVDSDKITVRGVNFFHLYNDGKRWWIMNCMWENEGNGVTIPKKMLKN